jgi:hypothetical protein
MFGNAADPSLNYSYGACRPIENLDLVRRQLMLANQYRNNLVSIELERRHLVESALAEMFPDLAIVESKIGKLNTEIENLLTAAKAANAEARKLVDNPTTKQELKALKAQRKILYESHKAARTDAFQSAVWIARQDQIDAANSERRKEARKHCKLYWGTYLAVEQRMGNCRAGAPPRLERFNDEGALAVQIQNGISPDEAFSGSDKRLIIDPLPKDVAWDGQRWKSDPNGPGKCKRDRTIVRLRIASNEGAPVWAAIPIKFHRPFPENCRIKWVFLHCRKIGLSEKWFVRFVISRASGWIREDLSADGIVGIDVGWRIMPEGLRVAYWVGDDGGESELVLPNGDGDWRYLLDKAEDLASIRDKHFNGMRDRLADWMMRNAEKLPAVAAAFEYLRQWRSKTRLGIAINQHLSAIAAIDGQLADELSVWWKKERHLQRWQIDNMKKFDRQRTAIYRQFAADITRRYHTIVVEKFDLRKIQREKSVEDKTAEDAAMKKHQRDANISTLRQFLRERAAEFEMVSAVDTTRKCHFCGMVRDFNRSDLVNKCDNCGATWDQDANAARNILAAFSSGQVVEK